MIVLVNDSFLVSADQTQLTAKETWARGKTKLPVVFKRTGLHLSK